LTVLDDHSRYAIVLRACADQKTQTVRQALVDAFGTVRNFVCGLGIMGTKEISHGPTQRACDT